MPSSARRPCAEGGCSTLVPRGRCAEHQKASQRTKDERRGSARARGYTHDWDRFSRSWLAEFPYCGQQQDGLFHAEYSRCVQAGNRWSAAEVTDHIVPMSKGGAPMDRANAMSLCRSCNSAKGDR